jgi:ribosomal protein S18 acetylase RimI-like enzyme
VPVAVRHITAADTARLKAFRLDALRADPDAFMATHASELARQQTWWSDWAAASEAGTAQRTYVAVEAEDRWLGFALVRDAGEEAELNAMWVAPAARGRRVAAALCDACADWARARGFAQLRLFVYAGNAPARRAYEAAGFELEELLLRRAL